MEKYTELYFKWFDYGIDSFVPCEICGSKATEIHHIVARSQDKSLLNDIDNIMAVCRLCHNQFGDKKQYMDYLKSIHKEFMENFNLMS